jgi:hypothetical protein
MNKLKDMKFDYIVQNPPYSRSLHLTFFEKSLDFLKNDGEMTIIEPATWLINVRKNGKAKIYDNIKKLIKGHVKSVRIENLNNEFQTNCFVPFSITKINMTKEYSEIEYSCCGANTTVDNLYDCNLIGSYDLIWSILKKVQKYGDMMLDHIYDNKSVVGNNTWYASIRKKIIGNGGVGDNLARYSWDSQYFGKYNLFLYHAYIGTMSIRENFSQSPIPIIKSWSSKHTEPTYKEGTIADNIYGSKEELDNLKYNLLNTKFMPFINLVLNIDQNNNSLPYIPWLVDKIYTDDEINELFDFTEDEINLIDKTIKKFERHSLWFKRYMCGPSSVSDEDVQKDLKEKGIC